MTSEEKTSREKPVKEKPASSKWVSFFLFADITIAIIVWAVFLTVTMCMHFYLGKFLDKPKPLFTIRLFELAIVSISTLWCILFFIKGFCCQDETEQAKGKLSYLSLGNITNRFLKIVKIQPIKCSISAIIVFVVLYGGISWAEILHEDTEAISIISCELICETGPDFIDNDLANMLLDYSSYLEEKHLAGLLKTFNVSNTAKNGLTDAVTILEKAKGSQNEVAHDIWRAGEEILYSGLGAPKFLPGTIRLREYRSAPEDLLTDIRTAMNASIKAAKLFDDKPNMDTAVRSCEENRKTMLLIFLARRSGQIELFDEFKEIVEACNRSKLEVAGRLQKGVPRNEFLIMIAESELRRAEILEAMKKRNNEKEVFALMLKAIDDSYTRRDSLLELCPKVLEKYTEIIRERLVS